MLLDGLGQVKMYLKGEFTIRQDQTANLPTDIQKEILGSMQEASPAGWEELNRQYFERLGQGKDAGPATRGRWLRQGRFHRQSTEGVIYHASNRLRTVGAGQFWVRLGPGCRRRERRPGRQKRNAARRPSGW